MNRDKFIGCLAAVCAVAWVVAAIHPLDRQAWILENILLVIFVGLVALAYRRLELSNALYLCIALFLLLQIVGAHYTYAKTPLALRAKQLFQLYWE